MDESGSILGGNYEKEKKFVRLVKKYQKVPTLRDSVIMTFDVSQFVHLKSLFIIAFSSFKIEYCTIPIFFFDSSGL